MDSPGANGAEHGVDHLAVPTVTIVMDPRTHLVSVGAANLPIAVVQMMLDEAVRQMDINRRHAAAMELARLAQEQRKSQELADSLFGKR